MKEIIMELHIKSTGERLYIVPHTIKWMREDTNGIVTIHTDMSAFIVQETYDDVMKQLNNYYNN